MPPRKRVFRTQAASASREGGDEHVPPLVPPIDQDALRQMVQDAARQAAQEAVQQAVQEAARVAAQEVVRQMAAAQQGQQIPPVQVHGHQQPPIQPVPPVQVQGQQQAPYPACSRGFSGSTTTTTCPSRASSRERFGAVGIHRDVSVILGKSGGKWASHGTHKVQEKIFRDDDHFNQSLLYERRFQQQA
ncbi:hypothetical protein F2Q69_00020462 [Brassica cretica]|uniref:Uncharacterized protein n=1 Tax=Brassica cretica TaxID=69181 RepID=A0A8S9QCX6_BRACR|nr:hypothetical protein F2Q69_00020462 [Brassica cretica]